MFVDDIMVPGGAGSTSFESDGNPSDGWHVIGPPDGSPQRERLDHRRRGRRAARHGRDRRGGSLDRQPEIVDFLEGYFGPYPFSAAGAIVDDADGLGFALENQTRPIYAKEFFNGAERATRWSCTSWPTSGTATTSPSPRWQHIWLNEGFASYAEWLWGEHEGSGTAQEIFDSIAGDPGRRPVLGRPDRRPRPGRHLFDGAGLRPRRR